MNRVALLTILASTLLLPVSGAGGASIPEGAKVGALREPALLASSCSPMVEDGSRTTVSSAIMPRVVKGNGTYDFSSVDIPVNGAVNCGVEPALRIFAQPSSSPDRGLPGDLDAYRAFIVALVDHLRGRVDRFGIENEVISTNHWTDTPDDYFHLLAIAADAIHATNPDAMVLDSVSSSGGFSIIEARKLAGAGNLEGALAVIQESHDNDLGGGPRLTSTSQVEAYLNVPKILKMQQFYDGLIANKGLIDALQLHYYGPSNSLPATIHMVRNDGMDMPIEIWELGHRFMDRPFDLADQSIETTRLLATAVGEGSRWNVLQAYANNLDNDMYGLIDENGVSRPARSALRTTTGMLTGVTSTSILSLPAGASGYRYADPAGTRSAIWSTGEPVPVASSLGISATTAKVTSNEGSVAHLLLKGLMASATPQWVEPDLLEIRRLAPTRKATTRISISCPAGSGSAYCAGRLRITGGNGNIKLLGERRYKIARGVTRVTHVGRRKGKKVRGVRSQLITAAPFNCPGGLDTCRSWQKLGTTASR